MPGTRRNISETLFFHTATVPPTCQEQFLPLNEPFAWPLREIGVILGGISLLAPPFTVGRTAPPYDVVLCTTGGQARLMTPAGAGKLGAGDVWVGPAGSTYRYEADGSWEVSWFHIARRHYAAATAPVSGQAALFLTPLTGAMTAFMAEAVRHEPGADTAARAYAEIVRVLLERELQAANTTGSPLGHQLAVLWERVHADLAAPWNVERLASALCVSPAHLHRLTQRHYAVSPMAMVARLRMRHAEAMLTSAHYTLDQVAAAVGYETPFSFSRAFKAYCGLSPRLFRAERVR